MKNIILQPNFDVEDYELVQNLIGSGPWRINFNENSEISSVYWSPVLRNMLGYSNERELPNDMDYFVSLIHKDDQEAFLKNLWDAVKDDSHQAAFDIEYRILTKNKGYRWFHDAGRISRRADGSPASMVGIFIDVDDEKRAKQQLEASHKVMMEQFHVLKSLADMYFSMHLIDLKNYFVIEYSCDEAIKSFLSGTSNALEMLAMARDKLIVSEFQPSFEIFTDLSSLPMRMRHLHSLSSEFKGVTIGWFLANFITIESDKDGYPTKILYTTQIIDESKRKEHSLFIRSVTDEMTGFLNRRAYMERLEYYRTHPIEDNLVIISFDINQLKYINDHLGHAAGDELICGFASLLKRLSSDFPRSARVFRTGGDEFISFVHASREQIKESEAKLFKLIDEWSGKYVKTMSASGGVVYSADYPNCSIDELIRIADKKMYEYKADFYSKIGHERS